MCNYGTAADSRLVRRASVHYRARGLWGQTLIPALGNQSNHVLLNFRGEEEGREEERGEEERREERGEERGRRGGNLIKVEIRKEQKQAQD